MRIPIFQFHLKILNTNYCFEFQEGVESRATQSVKVPVKSLTQIVPSLEVDDIQYRIGYSFLQTNIYGEDVGEEGKTQFFV